MPNDRIEKLVMLRTSSNADPKVDIAEYGYSILQVETLSACNMACTFCAYPTREDKLSTMPEEIVRKAISSVDPLSNGFQYINFSQFNEPLLDGRLPQFIHFAQQQGFRVQVITNGLLLRKPTISRRILDTPPNLMKISVQTPDRDQYEAERGVKLDFDLYIDGIHRFLVEARNAPFEIVVDVGCNFLSPVGEWGRRMLGLRRGDPSVPNSVKSMMPAIRSFLEGLKRMEPAFEFDPDDGESLSRATPIYWEEDGLKLAKNISFKIKPFGFGRRLQEFMPTNEPIACNNQNLGILADGSVVPCCMAYNTSLAMGNLKSESLHSILERNQQWLGQIKGETNQKPDVCKRCLGQPTKRGVVFSRVLNRAKPMLRKV